MAEAEVAAPAVAVLGFSYGFDAIASGRVYRAARAALEGCSIWRTSSEDGKRWSILVVDQAGRAADFDWSPGRPFTVQADLTERLIRRRFLSMLKAGPAGPAWQDAHYEHGAVITEGGTVEEVPLATCDFCGAADIPITGCTMIVADSFGLADEATGWSWRSLGSWLACPACAPLVEERDVGRLVEHVVGIRLERGDLPQELAAMHADLYRLMYASLYEFAKASHPALRFQAECEHPAGDVGPWGKDGRLQCRVCGKHVP